MLPKVLGCLPCLIGLLFPPGVVGVLGSTNINGQREWALSRQEQVCWSNKSPSSARVSQSLSLPLYASQQIFQQHCTRYFLLRMPFFPPIFLYLARSSSLSKTQLRSHMSQNPSLTVCHNRQVALPCASIMPFTCLQCFPDMLYYEYCICICLSHQMIECIMQLMIGIVIHLCAPAQCLAFGTGSINVK